MPSNLKIKYQDRHDLKRAPVSEEDPTTGIHAVFEDSLPRNRQRAAYLLGLLGPEAMGALAYTKNPRWQEVNPEAPLSDLSDLTAASERYEQDPDAPMEELMRLFKAGSSPGGARPESVDQ